MYTYQSSIFYLESSQSDELQTNGWDLELALELNQLPTFHYEQEGGE